MILRIGVTPLTLLVLLAAAPPAFGQSASPSSDSAVYVAVLDSLFQAPGTALIRQLYGARNGNLERVLGRWRTADWIDSNQVVLRTPDGGATIRFAAWLSTIEYSADSSSATLLARMACGGLCGSERRVRLVRARGTWRIASVVTTILY